MRKIWNKLVENKTIRFFGALGGLVAIATAVIGLFEWWEEGWNSVKSWVPWMAGCVVVYTLFWIVLVANNLSRRLQRYLADRRDSKRFRRLRKFMQVCLDADPETRRILQPHLQQQLSDLGILYPAFIDKEKALHLAWSMFLNGLIDLVDQDRPMSIREARKTGFKLMKLWLNIQR